MARLMVQNLEKDLRDKLQELARNHGRSLEEEVREILRSAVAAPAPKTNMKLGSRIASRFQGIGFTPRLEALRGYPAEPPDLER